MVAFGQSGCIRAIFFYSGKVVVFGPSGSLWAKVVLLRRIGCIWAKLLYLGKFVVFGPNWFY